MVTFRYVHQRHDFLDRHALVRVDRECRILLCLKQIDKVILQFGVLHRRLAAVQMVGVGVVAPILDRDGDRRLGRNLPCALRKQELQRVRIDQCRGDQEEDQQQEHQVSHRRHRCVRQDLCGSLECH